jgi:release factor glutamine methyltransferase
MSRITNRNLIVDATGRLTAVGIDTPRLDAETLLAHAAGFSRSQLVARLPDPVPDDIGARFASFVDRRLTLEPVAYIVGEKEFYGLPFETTPATLIPRPETELIVDRVLALPGADRPMRVADIGVGTGCIGITVAARRPAWRVTGVDISPAALAVARRNAVRHGVADRIDFVEGDGLTAVAGPLDIIASNPPYVPDDAPDVAAGVSRHEPHTALYAGPDGLDLIRRLIAEAPARLADGGVMFVEMGRDQGAAVATLVAKTSGLTLEKIVPDLAGLDRLAIIRPSVSPNR